MIKQFSGLANDLKLSKFWLKYIWLELIVKDFIDIKIEGQLKELVNSYNEKTKKTTKDYVNEILQLPLDSLYFCVQDFLGNWLVILHGSMGHNKISWTATNIIPQKKCLGIKTLFGNEEENLIKRI